MHTVLLVVDGSAASEGAAREVVRGARRGAIDALHLLNVQPSFDGLVRHFVGGKAIRSYQREAGERAVALARRMLDNALVPYDVHFRSGDPGTNILRLARELRVDEIVLSSDGDTMLDTVLQRLLIARVIRGADVPVVVVRAHPDYKELDLSTRPPPTVAA